jgi:hypothetical protein
MTNEPNSGTLYSTWQLWDCILAQTPYEEQEVDQFWNPPPVREGEPRRIEETMIIS